MAVQKTKHASDVTTTHKKIPPKPARLAGLQGDTKKLVGAGAGAVLVVGLLYVVGYTLLEGHHPWASEEVRAQAAIEEVLHEVSKKMLLPAGEPIMATVDDADVLRTQQAFFQHAETGDQLLIFPESAQAVLYSPVRGVIINVGPIQYGDDVVDSQGSVSPAPSQEADLKTPANTTSTGG